VSGDPGRLLKAGGSHDLGTCNNNRIAQMPKSADMWLPYFVRLAKIEWALLTILGLFSAQVE
jgi:hypothetical protein